MKARVLVSALAVQTDKNSHMSLKIMKRNSDEYMNEGEVQCRSLKCENGIMI